MRKKMTFGQRLRKIRKHFGISITEMSNTMDVVKSNISRYERDLIKPTVPFVEKLLRHYRVNLNWLFGERAEMFLKDEIKSDAELLSDENYPQSLKFDGRLVTKLTIEKYTSFGVPVYVNTQEYESDEHHLLPVAGAISAGEPMEMRHEGYDFVPFPMYKSTKDLDNYLVFRVNGLSMAPEVHHEDIVFIYRNENWLEMDKKIVAVKINGEMTLKKLKIDKKNQKVTFIALNKDYNDISMDFDLMGSTYLLGELKAIRRVYT